MIKSEKEEIEVLKEKFRAKARKVINFIFNWRYMNRWEEYADDWYEVDDEKVKKAEERRNKIAQTILGILASVPLYLIGSIMTIYPLIMTDFPWPIKTAYMAAIMLTGPVMGGLLSLILWAYPTKIFRFTDTIPQVKIFLLPNFSSVKSMLQISYPFSRLLREGYRFSCIYCVVLGLV